jgi:hypothetical protein
MGAATMRGVPERAMGWDHRTAADSRHDMTWHPLTLLRMIFAVLVCVMVVAGLTTGARPRTARQWTLVWAVMVFWAWALLGFGWLRA